MFRAVELSNFRAPSPWQEIIFPQEIVETEQQKTEEKHR